MEDNKNNHNICNTDWVELEGTADFCRLLYPNPVCFLSVVERRSAAANDDNVASPRYNVMVLSWLTTASESSGIFVFSLNKRRHTSSILETDTEFCLSIPTKGMEELVSNVGSTSGRWGKSKFPCHHPAAKVTISERKGGSDCCSDSKHENISKGAVAKLECIIKDYDISIDKDHFLVFAQVQSATVHSAYWDDKKNLFRPAAGYSPYLKYLGSQAYAYVVMDYY